MHVSHIAFASSEECEINKYLVVLCLIVTSRKRIENFRSKQNYSPLDRTLKRRYKLSQAKGSAVNEQDGDVVGKRLARSDS